MEKALHKPILVAAVGFIAGGILLGSVAISAEARNTGFSSGGEGKAIAAQVLGVDEQELKDLRGTGQSMEDFVLDHGYASMDDFHSALRAALTDKWQEDGLSEDEIATRLERMAERQAGRQARQTVVAELLNMTPEELTAAKAEGTKIIELVQAAGYEDIEDFHDAARREMEERGIDKPQFGPRSFGHNRHAR